MNHVVDDNGHIDRFFVCPAFMNNAIRYTRPVMSLDACHLKSRWKGTLYLASVKTPCDEIVPVAMAITKDNENEDGWTWFLQNLLSACEFMVVDHPKASVDYKYYMFISDRSKGLINALAQVFPSNEQPRNILFPTHCAEYRTESRDEKGNAFRLPTVKDVIKVDSW